MATIASVWSITSAPPEGSGTVRSEMAWICASMFLRWNSGTSSS